MKKIFTFLFLIACTFLTSCWYWGCQLSYMDIELNEYSVELSVGDEFQLKADVSYDNVDFKGFEWSSDNNKVATVSETGLVTAVGIGVAKIIASAIDYDQSAACEVKVNAVPATGIRLNKEKLELFSGEDFRLVPIFLPEYSAGGNVVWETSNSSVADVYENGLVVGLGGGTATITASIDNGRIKASCEVSIKHAEIPDLSNNIYTAGIFHYLKRQIPAVWKNGKLFYCLTVEGNYTSVYDVFVDGEDVYVAGDENYGISVVAKVWKNGKELYRLTQSGEGAAYTVCVYNGDIYVAGNDAGKPRIWKNGESLYSIPVEGDMYGLYDMSISDGNVYVAGVDKTTEGYIIKVFRNEELLYSLNHGSAITLVNAISVYNGDVYVAGCYEKSKNLAVASKIWKNGTELYVFDNAEDDTALVNSIFLYDGDVYAAGATGVLYQLKNLMLWKNGEELNKMDDSDNIYQACSVQVVNGDIYVLGNGDSYIDKVWKNGKVLYEYDVKNTYMRSMFVK